MLKMTLKWWSPSSLRGLYTLGKMGTQSPHVVGSPFFHHTGAASLIPRPSMPPVFDCLQYAKIEGEGLNFIT